MGTMIPRVFDFREGANTTSLPTTSKFPVYQVFDEVMVDRVSAVRRLGKVALHAFTPVSELIDFDGTNDAVGLPSAQRSSIISLLNWTVECLFVADTVSSSRQIIGGTTATDPGVMVVHNSSSEVVVTVTDSADTASTMTWTGVAAGTVCGLQVTRSGASLTGWLNGTSKTATMNATNALRNGLWTVGADNAGSYLDGAVDYLRGFNYTKTTQRDVFLRWLHPRSRSVLFDYVFTGNSDAHVLDRSTLEAHGTASGSPTSNRAPLAVNSDPILAIDQNIDTSGKTQAYVVVGKVAYPVRLT